MPCSDFFAHFSIVVFYLGEMLNSHRSLSHASVSQVYGYVYVNVKENVMWPLGLTRVQLPMEGGDSNDITRGDSVAKWSAKWQTLPSLQCSLQR